VGGWAQVPAHQTRAVLSNHRRKKVVPIKNSRDREGQRRVQGCKTATARKVTPFDPSGAKVHVLLLASPAAQVTDPDARLDCHPPPRLVHMQHLVVVVKAHQEAVGQTQRAPRVARAHHLDRLVLQYSLCETCGPFPS
jgi:hypothetical protein